MVDATVEGADSYRPRSDLTQTSCFLWSIFLLGKVSSDSQFYVDMNQK
jgi:hypothetical protein